MTHFDVDALTHALIGGLPLESFDRDIRERQPKKFEGAFESHLLDQLYSLSRLEGLLGQHALMPFVDIFSETHLKRLVDMQRKSGKSGLDVVLDCFREGSTIRVRDIERFDAHLSRFAAAVQRQFTAPAQINVYLTPPASTGFPPHFDITDVFVVQCVGTKEWRLYAQYANASELPLSSTNWDPDRFQPTAPGDAIRLRSGDVLYLPRGVMHEAICVEHESMHLTISIAPLTYADVLSKAIQLAADRDIELRRRIPWPPNRDDCVSALAATMLTRVRGAVCQSDIAAILAMESSSLSEIDAPAGTARVQSAIADLLERAANK